MIIRRIVSLLISTRKQYFILKSLIIFLAFVAIIVILSDHTGGTNDQTILEGDLLIPNSDFNKLSKIQQRKIIASLRQSVIKENTDEFLEIVLKQVDFTEINLKSTDNSAYDLEISDLTKRIDYSLGQDGAKASVPFVKRFLAEDIIAKEAFNRILSEMIALNRSVPDTRESACRELTYDTKSLPSLSVIIVFTNEAFISIIRMLHSLINRTPKSLLREIILVDDFSDLKDLNGKLERYLLTKFPFQKIRLLRLSKRSGLVRARMIGAHVAVGDVLAFLDAHCEVNKYWSEPLLQRIQETRTVVAVPVTDVIDSKTLEYYKGDNGFFFIGGFKWTGFQFYWIPVPEYETKTKKYHYQPTKSPTMAGGLFAIDRTYFWEMGSYDPLMEIWGGENLEMSFRIWQCGGSVEIIPCSRVGHIFRPFRPYAFNHSIEQHNIARVATVWMDSYKELVFKNGSIKSVNVGNTSKRVEFRQRKKCKDFNWYLSNIYKQKFRLHLDSKSYGQVKNVGSKLCLDDMGQSEKHNFSLTAYPCHKKLYDSQNFYLSEKNELRKELICAASGDSDDERQVNMKSCDNGGGDEKFAWKYDEQKRLINQATKKCLTVAESWSTKGKYEVVLETCGGDQLSEQKWIFSNRIL